MFVALLDNMFGKRKASQGPWSSEPVLLPLPTHVSDLFLTEAQLTSTVAPVLLNWANKKMGSDTDGPLHQVSILDGPSGCGKASLARVVLETAGFHVIEWNGLSILDMAAYLSHGSRASSITTAPLPVPIPPPPALRLGKKGAAPAAAANLQDAAKQLRRNRKNAYNHKRLAGTKKNEGIDNLKSIYEMARRPMDLNGRRVALVLRNVDTWTNFPAAALKKLLVLHKPTEERDVLPKAFPESLVCPIVCTSSTAISHCKRLRLLAESCLHISLKSVSPRVLESGLMKRNKWSFEVVANVAAYAQGDIRRCLSRLALLSPTLSLPDSDHSGESKAVCRAKRAREAAKANEKVVREEEEEERRRRGEGGDEDETKTSCLLSALNCVMRPEVSIHTVMGWIDQHPLLPTVLQDNFPRVVSDLEVWRDVARLVSDATTMQTATEGTIGGGGRGGGGKYLNGGGPTAGDYDGSSDTSSAAAAGSNIGATASASLSVVATTRATAFLAGGTRRSTIASHTNCLRDVAAVLGSWAIPVTLGAAAHAKKAAQVLEPSQTQARRVHQLQNLARVKEAALGHLNASLSRDWFSLSMQEKLVAAERMCSTAAGVGKASGCGGGGGAASISKKAKSVRMFQTLMKDPTWSHMNVSAVATFNELQKIHFDVRKMFK